MRRSLLAVVVAVWAVAACGDGDGDTTAAGTTTSAGVTAVPDTSDDAGASDTAGSDTSPPEEGPQPTTTVPTDQPAVEADDPGAPAEGGDQLVFVADLEGATVVPGPGDEGGSGRVETLTDAEGIWCFDMVVTGLDSAVTDAHVHAGAAGESGDVVIEIGPPTGPGDDTDTWTDVCVPVDDELQDRIAAEPGAFHADVHTETLPAGAIRGQLQAATIFDRTLS